jgi:hypothetical protein
LGKVAAALEAREQPWWLIAVITAAYATIVIVAAVHHEPWRDEVVPMTLARQTSSLIALWQKLRWEGHPVLWYLCLRYAYLLFGTTSVLPVLSVLFAVAALLVFLRHAPLPLWLKCLFVFGYFSLYEYSVIARGNGLAMLLLFVFCALYPRRGTHPVAVAAALALLANTTALGFLVAAAAGVMIVIDSWSSKREARARRHYAAVAVYLAALLNVVASNSPGTAGLPTQVDHGALARVGSSLLQAVIHPAAHSAFLYWVPFTSIWLWLLFVLLLRRPGLLAFLFLSLISFELTFVLVYPASPRHAGYVLLVVIATLWLGRLWEDDARGGGFLAGAERWLQRLLLVPLALALCFQVALGIAYVADDVQFDYSSSKRLAALIGSDPRLEQAIVIGEPETMAESLPYYRDNRIFLPQENAFRSHMQTPSISFSLGQDASRHIQLGRRADYDLGELLSTAATLRNRYEVPVVMVLGWWVNGPETQYAYVGTYFEQTFTLSSASRTEFLARTEMLGRLRDAQFSDEAYDVYVLW